MMRFATRRWLAGLLTAFIAVGLVLGFTAASLALIETARVTGWLLLAIVVVLTTYGIRRRLPYPPMLKSSTWLQVHAYIGLLSVVVFLLHVQWRMPTGSFEILLALAFLGVAISGILGLVLSRMIPPRLAMRGEEVLYERIDIFRRELMDRAGQLVLESAAKTETETLAEFYSARVADFLRRPHNFWQHVVQSQRPVEQLLSDLRAIHRYLNESERLLAGDLENIIRTKDNLDYHRAMQGTLKGWLFVHVPLTLALLILMIVHVILVHSFT